MGGRPEASYLNERAIWRVALASTDGFLQASSRARFHASGSAADHAMAVVRAFQNRTLLEIDEFVPCSEIDDLISGAALLHRAGRQGWPRRLLIRETIRSLDKVASAATAGALVVTASVG